MRTTRVPYLIVFASLLLPLSARADVVTDWNAIIVRCVAGPPNPAGRPGPTGVVDIALAHAAMHDAVQAIQGRFESYLYVNKARLGVGTPEAAAAAAAYRMLVGLYGAGQACLGGVTDPAVTHFGDPGLEAGYEAAAVLLQHKRPPFTSPLDPFGGGLGPGEWRPTPGVTVGANTYMAYTQPFTLNRTRQFRPEPPPPLTSERYRRDYDEVKAYGGLTGSLRSAAQTDLARLSDAAQEVVEVRILQGIHFRFADEAGRQQGQRVAHWAFQRFLRPLPGK